MYDFVNHLKLKEKFSCKNEFVTVCFKCFSFFLFPAPTVARRNTKNSEEDR